MNRTAVRTATALLSALALVLSAGCGSSEEADEESSDPPKEVVPADQLEAALLTPDEVGSEYEEDTDDPESTGGDFDVDQLDTTPECRELFSRFQAEEERGRQGVEVAEVEYAADDRREIQHTLTSSDQEQDQFDDFRKAVEECGRLDYTDGDDSGTVDFSSFDVPDLGDETLGFQIELVAESPTVSVEVTIYGAAIRRDDVVNVVTITSGFEDGLEQVPADPDDLAPLAEKADEKLAEVLAGES